MNTQPGRPLRWTVTTAMFAAFATSTPVTSHRSASAASRRGGIIVDVVGHG